MDNRGAYDKGSRARIMRCYLLVSLATSGCPGETRYEDRYVDSHGADGSSEGAPGPGGDGQSESTGSGGAAGAPDGGITSEGIGGSTQAENTSNSGSVPSGGPSGTAGETADGGDFIETATLGDYIYLKASNPDAQDQFGARVALADNWAVVSAPRESSFSMGLNGDQADDSEDRSGAVYAFSSSGTSWRQALYLKSHNTEATDAFGGAISFDGTTLAVGAEFEDGASMDSAFDNEMANSGAVYLYERDGENLLGPTYLKASHVTVIGNFGSSVHVVGDTLVVGASGESNSGTGVDGDVVDDGAPFSGAAYVFRRLDGAWSEVSYVKASNTGEDDGFGKAVHLDGSTLAIGAPGEASAVGGLEADDSDDSAPAAGAVYVFDATQTSWQQSAYVKPNHPEADARFGLNIALENNLLIVGAPGEGTASLGEPGGAVYVFERVGEQWLQRSRLIPREPTTPAYFGSAIALLGDTLIVGAWGDYGPDLDVPWGGAVYVYRRSGDGWVEEAYATAPTADANDRFGASVAITQDLIAVGTVGEGSSFGGINGDPFDNATPFAGAVYLFAR